MYEMGDQKPPLDPPKRVRSSQLEAYAQSLSERGEGLYPRRRPTREELEAADRAHQLLEDQFLKNSAGGSVLLELSEFQLYADIQHSQRGLYSGTDDGLS